MKVHSPWIVAITIAVVIALSAIGEERGKSVTIYSDDSLGSVSWRRDTMPVDRWVGIVLDANGWERMPAAVGVPWTRLGSTDAPNFDSEVAIVAFMGTMPTGGHAIALREVEFTAAPGGNASGAARGRLTLNLWVKSPGAGDIVTQAFTYPAAVAKVARDVWPQGVLEGVATGTVEVVAVDQDGRNWGPVHILTGGV